MSIPQTKPRWGDARYIQQNIAPINRNTLANLARRGLIRTIKLGEGERPSKRLYDLEALERYLESRVEPVPA